MLLGEFDFVDLMVDDPTTHWMAKVLFAAFLVVIFCIVAHLQIYILQSFKFVFCIAAYLYFAAFLDGCDILHICILIFVFCIFVFLHIFRRCSLPPS